MQGVIRTLVNPPFTLAEYEAEKTARAAAKPELDGTSRHDITYQAVTQSTTNGGPRTHSVSVQARGINEGFLNALAELYDRLADTDEIVSLTFWSINN